MSAVGTRRMIWQGGEHDFCLSAVGHIFSLEEACGVGIMNVLRRIETDTWKLNDVRETIRLALIGGGQSAEQAMALVKAHVDNNPAGLAPSVIVAHRVLEAVIVGVKDDPVGKQTAPGATTEAQVSSTTTAASGAPPSTELPLP